MVVGITPRTGPVCTQETVLSLGLSLVIPKVVTDPCTPVVRVERPPILSVHYVTIDVTYKPQVSVRGS